VLSLLGFTAGLAVAVVIVAALALLPMTLIRRTPLAPAVLVVVAAVGAAYASTWIVEGVLDADWSLERFANPWRVWPRNLVVALVVAALAAGARAVFAARGALRPVGSAVESLSDRSTEEETVASA
jgi:hypothetical protein